MARTGHYIAAVGAFAALFATFPIFRDILFPPRFSPEIRGFTFNGSEITLDIENKGQLLGETDRSLRCATDSHLTSQEFFNLKRFVFELRSDQERAALLPGRSIILSWAINPNSESPDHYQRIEMFFMRDGVQPFMALNQIYEPAASFGDWLVFWYLMNRSDEPSFSVTNFNSDNPIGMTDFYLEEYNRPEERPALTPISVELFCDLVLRPASSPTADFDEPGPIGSTWDVFTIDAQLSSSGFWSLNLRRN